MTILETPVLPILFFLGVVFLTGFSTALMRLGKYNLHDYFDSKVSKLFFFQLFLKKTSGNPFDNLMFIISVSKHILNLFYATTTFFFSLSILSSGHGKTFEMRLSWSTLLIIAVSIIAISLFFDFLLRMGANLKAKAFLQLTAPICSIYLTVLFPFVSILLKLSHYLFNAAHHEDFINESSVVRSKIDEILNESELKNHLDTSDQKLLKYFLTFREKLVREIMVPRMDIFSLSADTTLREAAKTLAGEGFSRIPIYKDSVDHIIGVVLYKDVLDLYAKDDAEEGQGQLDVSLETLVKPVIYAPENKHISRLLQEFKQKQSHLAIVVDEYGATEGIVTIEDILEELVGEIEDEYDLDEEELFTELPDGSWVVDAKMSILDIEEKLGISLPHGADYDTIGGYLFHRAGMVPFKGWKLQHDDFQIEVLSSDPRSIDKVQITSSTKKRSSASGKDALQKKPS